VFKRNFVKKMKKPRKTKDTGNKHATAKPETLWEHARTEKREDEKKQQVRAMESAIGDPPFAVFALSGKIKKNTKKDRNRE